VGPRSGACLSFRVRPGSQLSPQLCVSPRSGSFSVFRLVLRALASPVPESYLVLERGFVVVLVVLARSLYSACVLKRSGCDRQGERKGVHQVHATNAAQQRTHARTHHTMSRLPCFPGLQAPLSRDAAACGRDSRNGRARRTCGASRASQRPPPVRASLAASLLCKF
jgi:hypothetical protein